MKKLISVVLAMLLLLSVAVVPGFAAYSHSCELPLVNIHGNAQTIYDEDGVAVYDFDPDSEQVKACAKRVLPLLLKGLVTNDFDEYYRAFGEEMRKIYYHCQLDNNGDPQWGTGISEGDKASIEQRRHEKFEDENGRYDINGIGYPFDWRLDPLESVDGLNDFIDAILENSGKEKVNLKCNCLGGEMLLAYVAKYGTDKINSLVFTETVAFGSELVDDTFSGNFKLNADAALRFVGGDFLAKEMEGKETLRLFLEESLILAKETGAFDRVSDFFMRKLFDRLYEGLTPELCLATYGTWPGYWTMVTKDHYTSTRDFIFGQPGSERYEQYKGLIQKLDNWDVQVRQHIPELLQGAVDNGARLGISTFYGFQLPPVLGSYNENSDVWVSAKYASLGATVADIGTTLSEDYIAERTAAGFGKYISPDKQIDASTCAFPDYTWFTKGAVHNDRTVSFARLWELFLDSEETPTVDSFADFPQFTVHHPGINVEPMTEENMNTENFEINPKEKTFFEKIKFFFEHVGLWFKALFELIKSSRS